MTMRNDQVPSDAAAVTASDSTEVGFVGVYVGGTGNLAVKTVGGTTLTFPNVPAGTVIPIQCIRVMSTNTTASSIVGFIA